MRYTTSFDALERGRFKAILADPPWSFRPWSDKGKERSAERHYQTSTFEDLKAVPVGALAARDCVLFLWTTWPMLPQALEVVSAWGFVYKTCGFDWMKGDENGRLAIGMGYWTRSNTEPCLLATRGNPKRIDAGVPMAVYSPRREHSRKPELHERIERLVDGPYLELWARKVARPGWTFWGDEVTRFNRRPTAAPPLRWKR